MRATIEKILTDDLSKYGEQVPKWATEVAMPVINQALEIIGLALQNRISFSDNLYGTEITLTLTHGVAQKYSLPSGRICKGVSLIDASGQIVTGFGFTRNSDASISMTANFAAGGTTAASCLLQIQYR